MISFQAMNFTWKVVKTENQSNEKCMKMQMKMQVQKKIADRKI